MPANRKGDIAHWLELVRRYAIDGYVKQAAENNDTSFEQAFASLAHAYLRERAPTLLDYELGFQLLDRSDDNKYAAGVFAFRVGERMLFAPVFFIKGELKGHELLYLRDQDLFIPLKENWLNDLLSKKPRTMGHGRPRDVANMGARQPDFSRLVISPGKYANDRSLDQHPVARKYASYVRPFLPVYGHLSSASLSDAVQDLSAHCRERLNLEHFLKQASLPALQVAVDIFRRKPLLAKAFDQWHGLETLQTAIKSAKARMESKSLLDDPYAAVNKNRCVTGSLLDHVKTAEDGQPDYLRKVVIVTMSSQLEGFPDDLTESEKEKLQEDQVLIKDDRDDDEVSIAVDVETTKRLTNPTETGIYHILTSEGEFRRCLVVTGPHGPSGSRPIVTVVALDGDSRDWTNAEAKDVWSVGPEEASVLSDCEGWAKWFDGLPEGSISENMADMVMLVGPDRSATCPARIYHEIGSDGETTRYDAHFSCGCDNLPYSRGLARYHGGRSYGFDQYDPYRDGERLHVNAKRGLKIHSAAGDVFVPSGFKVLKLGDSCHGSLRLGRLFDASLNIAKNSWPMKLACHGSRYSINGGPEMDEVSSLVSLVRQHGLREAAGRQLLQRAKTAARYNKSTSCRIKYANPHMAQNSSYGVPAPMPESMDYNPLGFRNQTMTSVSQDYEIPELSAQNNDPSIYNVNPEFDREPYNVEGVQKAMETGQKEVFDVSMIGTMLKAVRDDTMIDRYVPDIIKGMDRVARVLLMLYAHQDQFAKRFGQHDIPELEDSLRNTFEAVGDVVLYLKRRSIEPYPEETVPGIDLSATADI